MDWKAVDERLIRRGELILDLESLGNHEKELEEMNKGRPGPRFRIANSIIQLLSAVRYLYQMPYRLLEGYTRALHRLVPELPPADQLGHPGNASSAYKRTRRSSWYGTVRAGSGTGLTYRGTLRSTPPRRPRVNPGIVGRVIRATTSGDSIFLW